MLYAFIRIKENPEKYEALSARTPPTLFIARRIVCKTFPGASALLRLVPFREASCVIKKKVLWGNGYLDYGLGPGYT